MTADFDLAVVGSGFGGSLVAAIAARLGLRVMLLERGRHPRFAIGESASPLTGVILEQLADRYGLPRLRPLASYGEWRRRYPTVVCGLKRGFTYFKHEAGKPYAPAADRSNQLLVAASPSDELGDTHWLRADVDHFLLREAVAEGIEYLDEVALESIEWPHERDVILVGSRRSRPVRIRAGFVVDASGPRGFLSHALGLDAPGFGGYPATQGLYSHFTGVARCEDMPGFACTGTPPYPIDAAALHHVFDDGWMWVLRFDNGVTSAGVAVTDARAAQLRLSDGEAAWARLLAGYPSIAAQFGDARPIREFTWMPRVPYRAAAASGERWAMLPSAAAFVDPLFSTGMPLTLLGIERIAAVLGRGGPSASAKTSADRRSAEREGWSGPPSTNPSTSPLGGYASTTLDEADHTARFIAGCYAAFPRFEDFTAYSMLYFVAASFSEMARRLGQAGRGFLCAADGEFSEALTRLSPACGGRSHTLADDVARAAERLNIAGLCDPAKQNWYGVDPQDTVRGAAKLGVSRADVERLLQTFAVQQPS